MVRFQRASPVGAVDGGAVAGQAECVTTPSSFRPLRWSWRDDLLLSVMGATRNLQGPDGDSLDLPGAHLGGAYKGRMGIFRKTLILWFPAPPEPSRLENARQAAGEWRVKVRVDPRGGPPPPIDGGGIAGLRKPRRPLRPSGSGRVEPEEAAE